LDEFYFIFVEINGKVMKNSSEILLYQTEDGQTKIQVKLEGETVWLSIEQMAELFQKSRSTINEHIINIFNEKELDSESVVRKIGNPDFSTKPTNYYNLDVIISVGYRVKSHRGTQFRIWATQRLREYIIKGFTLDDQRLKNGGNTNYFKELLERIRDIRSSEKVFYQQIKDIYVTSIDYDANADTTKTFFSVIQNKLLWAISGHTAAEIIYDRVDVSKPDLGLTSWMNSPNGSIRKTDVTISKNYLQEQELKALNLLVEQYLAFAEAQALQEIPMYMKDWVKKLNDILTINSREILEHAGRISKKLADEKAEMQFDIYREQQKQIAKTAGLKELEQDLKKLRGKSKQ
jgi:hypothetical protein